MAAPDIRSVQAEALRDAAADLERSRKGLKGFLDMISHSDIDRSIYANWLRKRADAIEQKQERGAP